MDLFTLTSIRALLRSRWYPLALQLLSIAVFALVLAYSFLGSPHGENNLASSVVWFFWWPLLPFLTFLFGRVWCAFCPLSTATGFLLKRLQGKAGSEGWTWGKYGIWGSGALLLLLAWGMVVWRVVGTPSHTGIVLLALLAGSLLAGIFLGRLAWCRHLCPIGLLTGLYSTASVVELRPRPEVCRTRCAGEKSCPASERSGACFLPQPFSSIDGNQNCNLCGDCVKNCRHASPRLRLRWPGQEPSPLARPALDAAVVVAIRMIVLMLDVVRMTEIYPAYMKLVVQSGLAIDYDLAFSLSLAAFTVIVLAALAIASRWSAALARERFGANFARFAYALLPLILAAHLGSALFHWFHHGPRPVLVILEELGLPVRLPPVVKGSIYVIHEPLMVLQLVLLLGGTLGGMYIVWRLAAAGNGRRLSWGKAIPHVILVAAFAGALAYLFTLPMGMLH